VQSSVIRAEIARIHPFFPAFCAGPTCSSHTLVTVQIGVPAAQLLSFRRIVCGSYADTYGLQMLSFTIPMELFMTNGIVYDQLLCRLL